MTREAWQIIAAAFPGADQLHRTIRFAGFRILHSGDAARTELDDLEQLLADLVEDPVTTIWTGVLAGSAKNLAAHLRATAAELDRASKALLSAQKNWNEIHAGGDHGHDSSNGSAPVRGPDEGHPDGDPAPF